MRRAEPLPAGWEGASWLYRTDKTTNLDKCVLLQTRAGRQFPRDPVADGEAPRR